MDPSLFTASIKVDKGTHKIKSIECKSQDVKGTIYLNFLMSDGNDWSNDDRIMSIEVTVSYKDKLFLSTSFGSEVSIFKRVEQKPDLAYVEQSTETITSTVRIFRRVSSSICGLVVIISKLDITRIVNEIN